MSKAMVVIDMQAAIMDTAHDADGVLQRVADLQKRARAAGVPVVHVQHAGPGLEAGTPGWQIHPVVAPAPGETVVHKVHCDSFHETELKQVLGALGADHLVIAGCQTDYCIDSTIRRAVTLGYNVTLVADGHSTEGNGVLSAEQIIAHHNRLLKGFGSEEHYTRVVPAAGVEF